MAWSTSCLDASARTAFWLGRICAGKKEIMNRRSAGKQNLLLSTHNQISNPTFLIRSKEAFRAITQPVPASP
jgi:hypothetical protein